jgi:hypothetical protein
LPGPCVGAARTGNGDNFLTPQPPRNQPAPHSKLSAGRCAGVCSQKLSQEPAGVARTLLLYRRPRSLKMVLRQWHGNVLHIFEGRCGDSPFDVPIFSLGMCALSLGRIAFCLLRGKTREAVAITTGNIFGAGMVLGFPKLLLGWDGFPNSFSDVHVIAPFGFGLGGCIVCSFYWLRRLRSKPITSA